MEVVKLLLGSSNRFSSLKNPADSARKNGWDNVALLIDWYASSLPGKLSVRFFVDVKRSRKGKHVAIPPSPPGQVKIRNPKFVGDGWQDLVRKQKERRERKRIEEMRKQERIEEERREQARNQERIEALHLCLTSTEDPPLPTSSHTPKSLPLGHQPRGLGLSGPERDYFLEGRDVRPAVSTPISSAWTFMEIVSLLPDTSSWKRAVWENHTTSAAIFSKLGDLQNAESTTTNATEITTIVFPQIVNEIFSSDSDALQQSFCELLEQSPRFFCLNMSAPNWFSHSKSPLVKAVLEIVAMDRKGLLMTGLANLGKSLKFLDEKGASLVVSNILRIYLSKQMFSVELMELLILYVGECCHRIQNPSDTPLSIQEDIDFLLFVTSLWDSISLEGAEGKLQDTFWLYDKHFDDIRRAIRDSDAQRKFDMALLNVKSCPNFSRRISRKEVFRSFESDPELTKVLLRVWDM